MNWRDPSEEEKAERTRRYQEQREQENKKKMERWERLDNLVKQVANHIPDWSHIPHQNKPDHSRGDFKLTHNITGCELTFRDGWDKSGSFYIFGSPNTKEDKTGQYHRANMPSGINITQKKTAQRIANDIKRRILDDVIEAQYKYSAEVKHTQARIDRKENTLALLKSLLGKLYKHEGRNGNGYPTLYANHYLSCTVNGYSNEIDIKIHSLGVETACDILQAIVFYLNQKQSANQ